MKKLVGMTLTIICITAIAAMFSSCGNSSSSSAPGAATALQVASRVSVVDAQDDSGAVGAASVDSAVTALSVRFRALSVAALPSDSDYHTDPSFTYVEERSAEAFDIINEILCYMSQTKYDLMLNEGDYTAQIDVDECDKERDDASSAGQNSQNQSSGANMTEYELWTVNSSRTNASSPHIVKVWFTEEADFGDPAQTFEVKVTITEGVSASNPFGLFSLQFKTTDPDTGAVLMTGYLKSVVDAASGEVVLQFYNDGTFGGGEVFTEQVTLSRSSDGTSGAGSTYGSFTDPVDGTHEKGYDIAYDDSYFYRSDANMAVCLDRTNPDVTAWRYGIYHDENHATPGKSVTINSGFPIKYNNYFGWAGYYGIWLPQEAAISNGDTIYKQDYTANGPLETPYTVFAAGGKLRKHTKKSLTLGEMANIPLHWHDCTGGPCTEFRVEWDSTAQKLYKKAQMDTTSWVWQDISPAQLVVFAAQAWDFNFYSDSLGGSGRVNLKDPTDPTGVAQITLSNATSVYFHLEETVYPGDGNVPTNLACFENCLDPSVINTASPYFAKSTWSTPGNYGDANQSVDPANLVAQTHYVPYTFDGSTMELEYTNGQTDPVIMTSNNNNQHGAWTGALMEPTAQNFALLACDWDPSVTCIWQAWDKLAEFYTWETGSQDWNKMTALQDGNSFVTFDPPISVEYSHTWDDATTSTFYLEYGGHGDLHGIPGKCVDMDTGLDADCWDNTGMKYIRWVPEFTVPNGSLLTDAVNGTYYYAKALEKEERMKAVAETDCTDAGLSIVAYTLPDGSDYVDPALGAKPTVDVPPAVIGGVVQ